MRRLIAIATVVLGVGLAACADDGDDADTSVENLPTESDPTAPVTEPSTTSAAIANPFRAERSMSATAELPDGSRYDIRLELGAVVPASDLAAGTPDGLDQPSVCSVDDERDLLIPARVSATSHTSGFNIDIPAGLSARVVNESDRRPVTNQVVLGDNVYSDGARCEYGGDWGTVSNVRFGSAQEGSSRVHQLWLVVKDFYSPATPDGDRALLGRAGIHFRYPAGGVGDGSICYEDRVGEGILLHGPAGEPDECESPLLPLSADHGDFRGWNGR